MPDFEVFTRRLVPLKKTPLVTIQKRGTISLNKSAYAALGEPEAVELLYDRDERVIGLRPAEPTLEHAYPVRSATGKGAGPFVISAIAFTKFYDIDTGESLRWQAQLIENVLCIDLDSTATPVTSNRAQRD
ncbi:MAG: hypothetical protein M3Y42_19245 [Actinomycetota bacterium]|nr:hypothetical protein [Actinomycetota bacterium]